MSGDQREPLIGRRQSRTPSEPEWPSLTGEDVADNRSGRPQRAQHVVRHWCAIREFGRAIGKLVDQVNHVLGVRCGMATAVGQKLGKGIRSSLTVASVLGRGPVSAAVGPPQRVDPFLE